METVLPLPVSDELDPRTFFDQFRVFVGQLEQRLALLERCCLGAAGPPGSALEHIAGLTEVVNALDGRMVVLEERVPLAAAPLGDALHDPAGGVGLDSQILAVDHRLQMIESQQNEVDQRLQRVELNLGGKSSAVGSRGSLLRVTETDCDTGAHSEAAGASSPVAASESVAIAPRPSRKPRMLAAKTMCAVTADETFQAMVDSAQHFSFNDTIFEAVFLVGLQGIRFFDSVLTCISLAMAIFMQVLFVTVLQGSLVKNTLPSIASIEQWRTHEGNHLTHMGPMLDSLASRVCRYDETLPVSQDKVELLEMLQSYSRNFGWLLGLMGSLVWFLQVSHELKKCIFFTLAIHNVPIADATSISVTGSGQIELKRLSRSRRLFLVSVTLVRAILAMLLGLLGSQWLIWEQDMRELILNVGALQLILDIDIVVYHEVASRRVTEVVKNMVPLSMKEHPIGSWGNVGTIHLLLLFCSMGFLAALFGLNVWPLWGQINGIMEAMCREPMSFVYAETQLGLFVAVATVATEENLDVWNWHSAAATEAVKEVFDEGSLSNSTSFVILPDMQSMNVWAEMPPDTASSALTTRLGTRCTDFTATGEMQAAVLWSLRKGLQDASVSSCSDMQKYCQDEAHRLVRAVCPETCGCALPRSGLFWQGPMGGCPTQACHDSPKFISALRALPCEDERPEVLKQSQEWASYWSQWFHTYVKAHPATTVETSRIHFGLEQEGCGGLSRMPVAHQRLICTGTDWSGSVASFCPEVCKCTVDYLPGCPPVCAPNAST